MIVLRDGAAFLAREYWVEGGQMHCRSGSGHEELIALDKIDLDQTVLLNRDRRVDFVLRSRDAIQQ